MSVAKVYFDNIKKVIQRIHQNNNENLQIEINALEKSFQELEHFVTQNENNLRLEIEKNLFLNDELRKSQRYLDTIYQNIDVAIFVIDVIEEEKFVFVGLNPTHEKLTGIKSEEVKGKEAEEFVAKEIAQQVEANYRRCVQEKKPIVYEEQLFLGGRDTYWITRLIPIFDDQGRIFRIVGASIEITRLKQAELEAKRNEKFLNLLLETIAEPVFYKDLHFYYISCNSAFEKFTGISREQLKGKTEYEIFPQELAEVYEKKDRELLSNPPLQRYLTTVLRVDGISRDCLVTKALYTEDGNQKNGVIVGVFYDVTELKQTEELLRKLTIEDELTGLYNKRGLKEIGHKIWRDAYRTKKRIAILMIDIDYFKLYNDYYGHQAGDRVLVNVAEMIKRATRRPLDIAGRYGGEEFLVILPETDSAGMEIVARGILSLVRDLKIEHFPAAEKILTVSIGGFSAVPQSECCLEDFIQFADEKLYEAKRNGRNCFLN